MKPGKPQSSKSEMSGLTIVFENWTTPVIAIVMLLAGLAGGFFARPFFSGGTATPTRTADQNPSDLFVANVNRDPQGMMDKSVQLVRHWRGEAGAPIRLIEFADYQ